MLKKLTPMQGVGILFICIYATILIRKIPLYDFSAVIWYCDWIMLFAGFAMLFKLHKLMAPLFVQSVLVQSPWVIDSFFLSAFGLTTMNLTNYLFNDYSAFDFSLALRHFIVIPLVLWYFSFHSFHKGKLVHMAVATTTYLFITSVSLLWGDEQSNTNCAYKACINFLPEFGSIVAYQFFFMALLAVGYSLVYLLFTNTKGWQSQKAIYYVAPVFAVLALLTVFRYLVS